MSESGRVAVIIPAAGEGKRLGGHRKQFRVLGGKSVLVQTLLVFERHAEVNYIVVATPREAVKPLSDELKRVGISKLLVVVEGGTTRQASVEAAIAHLPEDVDVVLVHDAVRPFVRMSKVSQVIGTVRMHGAAALAIGISDTVRNIVRSDDGHVEFGATESRELLVRMQTPQGFRKQWLVSAYKEASLQGIEATDDVDLVQRQGQPVVGLEGCSFNVKITTQQDWEQALRFWDYWQGVLVLEEREQIVGQETK